MDRRRSHPDRRSGLIPPALLRAGRLLAFPVHSLLDLLYPPVCPLCDELLDRPADGICPACRFAFDAIEAPVCPRCGQAGPSDAPCPDCLADPLLPTAIRSAFAFGGPVREAIHLLKFGRRRELAPILADALLHQGLPDWDFDDVDLLVPVPLHRRRRRQRGFNQAALLARRLARAVERPLDADLLRRIRATPAQTRCASREDRRANVAAAFALAEGRDLTALHVCLVDDVVTSGATLHACAGVLFDAGARAVSAVTIARTPVG